MVVMGNLPSQTRFRLRLCAVLFGALAAHGCSKTEVPGCTADRECGKGSFCVKRVCRACPACATNEVCLRGFCFPFACGDRPCPAGEACDLGECIGSECVGVSCGAGEACAQGRCFPKDCADSACGFDQVCADAACVADSCVGVACGGGERCANGLCLSTKCSGVVCGEGAVCTEGRCTAVACLGIVCRAGTLCADGRCVPTQCQGQPCPAGQVCSGKCADAGCVGVSCPAGTRCDRAACLAPEGCGAGGRVDTGTDPLNCGACGASCPVPLHAQVRCLKGTCGRGPCEPGTFDLGGTFGCESTCSVTSCTDDKGLTTPVSATPLPESGLVQQEWVAGASHGEGTQTNAAYTNFGELGSSTPPVLGGGVEMRNTSFINLAGFATEP